MDILPDKQLANYVTIRIGGPANEIIVAHSEQDITEIVSYAKTKNSPLITLGAGSNIVFRDNGFSGVVLINRVMGLEVDDSTGLVHAGSGVFWDAVVQKAIDANLCGIESLSAIPGTVGAAPVNNIGAYGQEIKDTLVSVRAFDTSINQFIDIPNDQCGFSYRDSRFKTKEHGRFIISQITLQLKPTPENYQAPNYSSLIEELNNRGINIPQPKYVRQTVIALRQEKLPDPVRLANSGSFFKNPIVPPDIAKRLLQIYPDMPHYPQTDGTEKLAAAWLIDQSGLKSYKQNGIWVYDKQALVLINESAKSFTDLWLMVEHIISTVNQKFGVILEPEPEII